MLLPKYQAHLMFYAVSKDFLEHFPIYLAQFRRRGKCSNFLFVEQIHALR